MCQLHLFDYRFRQARELYAVVVAVTLKVLVAVTLLIEVGLKWQLLKQGFQGKCTQRQREKMLAK